MELVIDHRETKLKELFSNEDEICYENLAYGDIIFKHEKKEIIVIERKTLADLAASIKDGRLRNQKLLLLSKVPRDNLYYVIEGGLDFSDNDSYISGISKKALITSVLNTMVRDGIKTIQTRNLLDTANLVLSLRKRLTEHPEKYTNTCTIEKQVLKAPTDNIFQRQLMQIPGISNTISKVLLTRYGSMKRFYEVYDGKPLEEIKEDISSIKIDNRRISSAVVENILVHMFDKIQSGS